jgi:hypothetical protein
MACAVWRWVPLRVLPLREGGERCSRFARRGAKSYDGSLMQRYVLLLPLLLSSCVTLGGVAMVPNAVKPAQRTVLIVYASPGPVMRESDSNIKEAAKVIPGLSFIIGATQSKRDLGASQSLKRLLGPYEPAQLFYPQLRKRLSSVAYPGRFVTPAEAEISPRQLKQFNSAKDINDWLLRISGRHPQHPVARDYRPLPQLRDALVMEIDFSYGAPSDGKGNYMPTLTAVTKLFRASDMMLLWRHENSVEDKAGSTPALEFRRHPAKLLKKYEQLMPQLAQQIAQGLAANLAAAGVR